MQTQLIISRVDLPRGCVRHGERYPVKEYIENLKMAVITGDDGREHRLSASEYTTPQEQKIKYDLARVESEQNKQKLVS